MLTFLEVGSFYLSDLGGIFSNHAERMAELETWRSYGMQAQMRIDYITTTKQSLNKMVIIL
jgi:hypothetical protein